MKKQILRNVTFKNEYRVLMEESRLKLDSPLMPAIKKRILSNTTFMNFLKGWILASNLQ
jgi:hypothetical protein